MTATNCRECRQPFAHAPNRNFCSKSCRLKAWHRERRAKFPEKVRAEENANYLRHREKKMAKMREYHTKHREEQNAKNRANRASKTDYYRAKDQARWTGERRQRSNEMRKENGQRSRLESPWKALLKGAEQRARRKGVPFKLSGKWVKDHWTGRCELTGIEFVLGQRGPGPKAFSPSIDRIKPELGYTDSNCRFVIWAVNAFKAEGDDAQMFEIARALLSYANSPNVVVSV